MIEVNVAEVKKRLDSGEAIHLLDVREDFEVEICSIPGAEHIPMMELFTGIKRTSAAQDAAIVVYCHTGIRSLEAAQFLSMQGFSNARSMAGGVAAWAAEVDGSMRRY